MPAYTNPTAEPRAELSAVVRQGQGFNKWNIWSQILPQYGVTHKIGHLVNLTIALANMMRIMDKIVEPGADIERVNLSFGDQNYSLVIRKEEVVIPDEVEMTYSDYFSVEEVGTQGANDKLELTHEFLTGGAIFNTATFGAATNSLVAYTEANLATISFIADIYAAIERGEDLGEIYNTIIIPVNVYRRVRRALSVLQFVRGTLMAQVEVNEQTIQKALADIGIEKVLIGRSRYNSAGEGVTPAVLSKIWPETYIWVGRTGDAWSADEDGIETVEGVGATLFWEKYGMNAVETYRDEPHEANVIRAKTSAVPYIANANCGQLIATQYS
jgi:hypothetical protein